MNLSYFPSRAPSGRLNPAAHQFAAEVNGKPTGLAGCASHAGCLHACRCLRARSELKFRWPFVPAGVRACDVFIEDRAPHVGAPAHGGPAHG
jgi:hypothetical protein